MFQGGQGIVSAKRGLIKTLHYYVVFNSYYSITVMSFSLLFVSTFSWDVYWIGYLF